MAIRAQERRRLADSLPPHSKVPSRSALWSAPARRFAATALGCLLLANLSLAASYDELIFDAQRYGSTQEKRDAKKKAWDELMARGPDGLREVMKRIHLENVMVGVLAQNMILEMPASNTAPVLVEFLTDEHPQTRKLAAFFLGWHETPEYADKVLPLLKDDDAAGAAMRTLGKWKAKTAVPSIVPFLTHKREVRRIAAANALRDMGDPSVIPQLKPLLKDRYFTVREVAKRAIAVLSETQTSVVR